MAKKRESVFSGETSESVCVWFASRCAQCRPDHSAGEIESRAHTTARASEKACAVGALRFASLIAPFGFALHDATERNTRTNETQTAHETGAAAILESLYLGRDRERA